MYPRVLLMFGPDRLSVPFPLPAHSFQDTRGPQPHPLPFSLRAPLHLVLLALGRRSARALDDPIDGPRRGDGDAHHMLLQAEGVYPGGILR